MSNEGKSPIKRGADSTGVPANAVIEHELGKSVYLDFEDGISTESAKVVAIKTETTPGRVLYDISVPVSGDVRKILKDVDAQFVKETPDVTPDYAVEDDVYFLTSEGKYLDGVVTAVYIREDEALYDIQAQGEGGLLYRKIPASVVTAMGTDVPQFAVDDDVLVVFGNGVPGEIYGQVTAVHLRGRGKIAYDVICNNNLLCDVDEINILAPSENAPIYTNSQTVNITFEGGAVVNGATVETIYVKSTGIFYDCSKGGTNYWLVAESMLSTP